MGAAFARLRRGIVICTAAALIAWPIAAETARYAHAAGTAPSVAPQAEIRIIFDGETLAFTPAPIQRNGVTLVPMRQMFAALGAEVTWEPTTQTIFAKKDALVVTLQIGSRQAIVGGKSVALETPVLAADGAAMVPLRLVGEAFGARIAWDASTGTIFVETPEYAEARKRAERVMLTPAEIVDLNDDRVVMITTDTAQGSGVIVGGRWVLTNWHVINGSSSGSVILNDGTNINILGVAAADEDADLAIVQTTRSLNVAPASFADPSEVRKGDRVVAIGSPLGYRNTVSEGLISNLIDDGGLKYYQINAPVDRGSSGGAVFNEYGELIGITTAVIRDTLADLNFAVPAHYAEPLLAQLEANPPALNEIRFPGSRLPDSLEGASNEEIRALLEEEYGSVQTLKGMAEFTDWTVTRDEQGWLVVTAVISPAFYMLYRSGAEEDLRWWAIDLAYELRRMLPDVNIEIIIYYSQVFNAEPRGLQPGAVTNLGDGRWRIRYEVMHLQYMDRMHLADNL